MMRTPAILVYGPPAVDARGFNDATGLCEYRVTDPNGSTLTVFGGSRVEESELKRLGSCWFRDMYARQIRRGARLAP